jgi:hypothetical protein
MRRYGSYGLAVFMSGLGPVFNGLGLLTILIGGSVLASLRGWPAATVAAAVAISFLLVALVGGYRVSRSAALERDDAQKNVKAAQLAVPTQAGVSMSGVGHQVTGNTTVFAAPDPVMDLLSERRIVGPRTIPIRQLFPADKSGLANRTFENCTFTGPAVLAFFNSDLIDLEFDIGGYSEEAFFWEVLDGSPVNLGVLSFRECEFRQCRFVQCGVAGDGPFLDRLKESTRPAET